MDIASIDPNFRKAEVDGVPVEYVDALAGGVFRLSGFPWRAGDGALRRLPADLTRQEVNDGALFLAMHTSGGQLAFRTDSRYIALRAELNVAPHDMDHMPRTGSSGFDFYEKTSEGYFFRQVVGPSLHQLLQTGVEQMVILPSPERTMRSWRVNFPLYGGVRHLEIGLEPGASVEAPEPFKLANPVVLYGGSIFQGACASRPGNSLGGQLCRALDAELIDLGFSGCGLGEAAIARKITELDFAALILGCELNPPTAEMLRERMTAFYDIIRAKHPEKPIVFVTQGDFSHPDRTAVITGIYERGRASGDTHVHLVTRRDCFADLADPNTATVDGCHPNDLGFYLMCRQVLAVLQTEWN